MKICVLAALPEIFQLLKALEGGLDDFIEILETLKKDLVSFEIFDKEKNIDLHDEGRYDLIIGLLNSFDLDNL